MRRAFCLIFLLSILFAFASCDEEVLQNVVVVKEEVSKEVPAEEGGTVSSSDDSVTMTIPADALDSDTKITMTVYESTTYDTESDEEIVTKVVECEPSGTVFKKPVFITLTSGTDIKNRIITAAVYNTEKEAWSYSPTGAAVKIAGYDAAGDPIMTTAAGDPIMLNAAGDPIMMSAAGDPIMLSAAGDPIMVTAAGDPIMNSAAGDPIMMTTGHFTTYTFLALGKRTEPEDSGDEGDDDEEDDTDGEPYVPECGNGITDEGEECDHGEENSDEPGVSNSTCRKDCTFAKCGDNIKDSNEACDDGNTADGDYCSADCQTVTGSCGDGEVQGNEACDDGNTADGDYCSADCQTVTGSCGDGEVQTNEECDKAEDNGKTACVYGETSCTVCTTECKNAEGEVSFCGDGVIDEDHETCDKSADNGKLDCAYGETECTVCTAACQTEAGKTSLCGDGTTDSANGEACDNGADNGKTACEYGLQNCTVCTTNCQIKVGAVSFCGDGEIDEAHETCDNAGDNGRTACAYGETSCPVCTAECQTASGTVSFCGDGIKDESNGEACDNGSDNGRANCAYGETGCTLCTANCQISEGAASYCGDGIKDESNGEQCDNGSENGATDCAYGEAKCTVCTANCQTAKGTTSFCGDGIVDEAGGEVCDDGNAADGDYCSADCREITGFCGDGIVQGNEACDNAEPDVTPEFGSDAPGEGTGGYCSEDCQEVTGSCGDGIIQREDCEGYENCTELAGISEACDNGADNGRMFCNYGEEGCTLCTTECQIFEGSSSYCGDGIVDKSNGEVCDNGSDNGRTACAYGETSCTLCSAQCTRIQGTVSYCGDGRVDAENGETCDDGSNLNGIYGHCNTTCSGEASRCGDGNVDSANGETCDDGELNGTYNHCNTTCNGRAAYCGDGRIDEDHETCDNGADNGRTTCAYGEMNCTVCTTECQENQGVVSRCGDGIVDSANGEQCDNGESNGATNCAYGETNCTLCSTACRNVSGAVSYCGDGRVDAENGETCDDGSNLNGTYGHCNATCDGEAAHCGDGTIDVANGETCDDGELNGTYSHCNTTCNGDASYCGDGVVDSANGEVCDHGFGNGATDCLYGETSCALCSTECQPVTGETSFCGDETIDGANGEQCDGGELNGQTNCEYGETSCILCSAACQNVKGAVSYCGDGRIDAENGETCDDGSNLNGTYGHCNATCNGDAAHCGDGNVDSANGETCDDGELNGTYSHCNATCNGRAAHCGDGNIDEGNEICDNGSDNGETKCAYGATECQVCTTDCQPVAGATSYCGDGERDEAHEACDSGELNGQTNCAYNETECQRCSETCQLVAGTTSYCGDGRVDEDHEACDNGASNGETKCAYGATECQVCTTECQSVAGETSFCGDGERDETHEACDNGELNGATNCVYGETSCTLCSETCQNVKGAVSYCGDGRIDAENGETCDDGANLNGTYGHCNATCNGEAAHCGDGNVDSANGETCDDGELNGTYSHCNATCNGRAAHCGDGNIDEGNEICDNGSDNGETKCAYGDHECTLCTTDCQPVAGATSYCGDGETDEAHEACDNGELNGITECAYNETECQRCASNCQLVAGTTSYCGDGRVDEAHEACDNGSANGETKCAYGATECQVCTTECQSVAGETSFCGDGERDETHEACDNGELNGQTNCVYGETSCTLCSETCQNVKGAVSYCGDGRIDAENGETCDDGSNLNGTYGHCNATCNGEAAHCGDGTIDSANGETCDDGELNGTYSHCNATCNGRAAHCGDGNIDEGNETCDDGADNGRTNCAYGETECTLCTTDCQPVAGATSYCGDGETDEAHEACDNGELNGITECAYNETECQRCASNCQLVAGTTSYCGDGRVDEDHEGCDNGSANGETKCAYGATECQVCTTQCQPVTGETSYCGDGERDEDHEACDNGELNGATNCVYGETSCMLCSETCQNVKGAVSYCGDGRIDAENGETCDDGSNLNGTYGHCNATCDGEAAHCGDGTIDVANGETCDDGELNGTYSKCNATCNGRAAHCGDGNVDGENDEECDNGEANGETKCAYGETECTLCTTECHPAAGNTSFCGDETIDTANGEQCDSGEANGETSCIYGEESCTLCSETCRNVQGSVSYCGDGIVDGGNNETCDDGAILNGRYGHCNATCDGAASRCGDGVLDSDSGEQCDDGELNGTYGKCNATCSGRSPFCGDGNIDTENGEVCDNGTSNGATDCAYGDHECTLCSTQCQPVQGETSFCGDSTIDTANGEQCDNGELNGQTNCAYGEESCTLCSETCQNVPGAVSYCGDGRVDAENNETCDDGANLNGTYGHCNATCSGEAAHCGDGNIDSANGETCDDGELNGTYSKCNAACNGRSPFCGDGNIDEGHETCDNGAENGRTACAYGEHECTLCSAECQPVQGTVSYCGDNNIDEANNEACDSGELNGQTKCAYGEESCTLCSATCQPLSGETSFCGDGRVDETNNETCDDGANLNGTYGHCNATCSGLAAHCGDGNVDTENNETCDEGEANGTYSHCNATCSGLAAHCGDGNIDEGNETCDNGAENGATDCAYGEHGCTLCSTQCQPVHGATSYCGDGTKDEAHEACDNGELNGATDCAYGETECKVCTAQCIEIQGATSYCGDGRVDTENNETCDEGSLNGTYGHCNATCNGEAAHCGDGNIDFSNNETCDDGELNGTYGKCNATCNGRSPFCGDGNIDEGHETCDNGAANGATECAYGEHECSLCSLECHPVAGAVSYCGDGTKDETNGEQCDNADYNGVTNCAYNETECTVCTAQCREIQGAVSYCGDSTVDAANEEECDKGFGNGIAECAYGETSCTVCTAQCKNDTGVTSYCGDSTVDTANGEQCDSGEENGTTKCAYGETACLVCSAQCREVAGAVSYCGDGIIDEENNETCDEGANLNGTYGHCSATCSGEASHCGDGTVDTENGETCDDGELNGTYGKCNATCSGLAAHCGDGTVDTGNDEECDKGAANGETKCAYGATECQVCTAECQLVTGETSYCGDNSVDAANNEACDRGELNGQTNCAYNETECTVCTAQCREIPGTTSYCGDGVIDEAHNEICDRGFANGVTDCVYGEEECTICTADCHEDDGEPSYCGDSVVDAANGEQCDNGEGNGETDCEYGETSCTVCTAQCRISQGAVSYCGDGVVDEDNGEECDEGSNLNGTYGHCNATCDGPASYCGDGTIDAVNGEECDNGDDNGATECEYGEESCTLCTEQCREISGTTSYCGDGRIDEDNEELCDNGAANGATECAYGATGCEVCTSDCQPVNGETSYCGDRTVDTANGEQCDNGELNGMTECTYGETSCTRCTGQCREVRGTTSYCGDGRVDEANEELCDDGNAADGDYCSSDCRGITGSCGDGIVQSNEACDKAEPEAGGGEGIGSRCSEDCSEILSVNSGATVICTGQTRCADAEGSIIDCPLEGEELYGQDAHYTARGSCIPQSYEKVTVGDYEVVDDLNTGLRWYIAPTGGTWENAVTYCGNLDMSDGRSWRLPTAKELITILDGDANYPALRTAYFTVHESYNAYWSSTYFANNKTGSDEVLIMDVGYGKLQYEAEGKEGFNSFACVSGDEYGAAGTFTTSTVSDVSVVTDSATNLMWQPEASTSRTWTEAIEYCENLEYAGFDDWRVPNRNELATLLDHSLIAQTGLASSFPNIGGSNFWTSTYAPTYGGTYGAFIIEMMGGTMMGSLEIEQNYRASVLCVRSGELEEYQSVITCNETGFAPCRDEETGIVWSPNINTNYYSAGVAQIAQMCRESTNGGISQWRAPTINELRTILRNSDNLYTGGACNVTNECNYSGSEVCYDSEICETGEKFESIFHDATFISSGTPTEEWNGEDFSPVWFVNFGSGAIESYDNDDLYPLPAIRCVKDESLPDIQFPYTDTESGLVWSSLSREEFLKTGADDYCGSLNEGGYSDWRVPTMEELVTLVRNCPDGECEPNIYGAYSIFADVSTLWSSTVTRSQTPTNVENYYNVMNFMTASQMELSSEEIQTYYTKVRCVRSEAAAPDPLPECSEGTTPCLDSETALSWSSKFESMGWDAAVSYCENLEEGGYTDWRLPKIDEIRTLVQNCEETMAGGLCLTSDPNALATTDNGYDSCHCEYISNNGGHYSKLGDDGYFQPWSSSVVSDDTDKVWCLDFSSATIDNEYKEYSRPFRCVRSEAAAPDPLSECGEGTTPCLDTATELAWSSKSAEIEWEDALSYCENLEEGGYSDWRLPNIDELRTIIRNCTGVQTGGACPTSEPDYLSESDAGEACWCDESMSNIFSDEEEETGLWSSSVVSDDTDFIWFIEFYNKDLGYVLWNSVAEARCVRSDNPPAGQEPRQVECTGLPARAVWNNTGTVTQTWHLREREWLPSSEGSYNEEASSEECRFKCIDGYTWSGRSCVVITPYTDPETSLTWSAESDSNIDWENAASYCEDLEEGGYTDWRLPTVDELRAIIQNCEKTQPGGACAISDPDHLSSEDYVYDDCRCTEEYPEGYSKLGYGDQYGMLWSSSGNSYNNNYAWAVSFTDGTVFDSLKVNHLIVRCVRSAQQSQVDLCDPNPCIGIANSNESCSVDQQAGYSCGCESGYFWDGEACQLQLTLGNICTGLTKCYNTNGDEITCPAEGEDFYGQDAQYAALGKCTPQSFTVRTIAGDNIVFDNNTGLQWQQTFSEETFSWDNARTHCENLTYGGYSDWRLPSPVEIQTISDQSRSYPGFDTTYFTNITNSDSSRFWTSQERKADTTKAYFARYLDAMSSYTAKTTEYNVMCVRGEELPSASFTTQTISGADVVTDSTTGLMWQKTYETNTTWQEALSYCENLEYAGYSDWRLPNRHESEMLLNYNKTAAPYSDFPDMPGNYFWSSTTLSEYKSFARYVNFEDGYVSNYVKTHDDGYVRCVRTDPCASNPCYGMENSDGQCSPDQEGGYLCGCDEGYFWNGEVCLRLPECSSTSETPCYDSESTLTWSAKSSSTMVWDDAISHCENLTEGGYDDWHLPNIDELRTLIQDCAATEPGGACGVTTSCLSSSCTDYSCFFSCSSDSTGGHSKFGEAISLWSSSTQSDDPDNAWYVDFNYGYVLNNYKIINNYVRCVRTEPDPCENNPCTGIEHSNESCSVDQQAGYSCGCESGYTWNGEQCVFQPLTIGNICTNQTSCYNASSSITCPTSESANFFGQDAQYAALGKCTAQSFTAGTGAQSGTVIDNNTGLVWEQSPSENTYTWDNAQNHCADLNSSNYGGKSNWRVPNPLEFMTIVDNSTYEPATNSNFTGMPADDGVYIWTSAEYKGNTSYAYVFKPYVGDYWGDGSSYSKTNTYKVLCVSGDEMQPATSADFTFLTISGADVVTDSRTGLMWQKEYVTDKTWQEALKYCEDLSYAGYSDWRLPNKNELLSLMNYEKSDRPYSYFPDMPDDNSFLSSSPHVYNTYTAWRVHFGSGDVGNGHKSSDYNVRCVR